jgi:formiminotetrahydrofolate cyclodeaminase
MAISDLSCKDFIHALGSAQPAPGGGGAAALVGAVGTALGHMVGSFTVGKKKYAEVEEEIQKLIKEAEGLEQRLLDLVEADAQAFLPLSKAYGLPATTSEEKAEKARVMEICLKNAAQVPLEIIRCSGRSLELLAQFAAKGSAIMISDAGCGAACCRAVLEAAALNVFINTKSMQDNNYAARLNQEVSDLLVQYTALADRIYAEVLSQCRE